MSETALKAREHHLMHALIVRSYAMSGSLSLTIDTFLVLNFGNEFTFLEIYIFGILFYGSKRSV